MDFDAVTQFVQEHFTDGLVLIVGSGLSAAEGLPGMPQLAEHLSSSVSSLPALDTDLWKTIEPDIIASGLEAALLKHAPTESLEAWIVGKTCDLLLPKEKEILAKVIGGTQVLRLTTFLSKILKPTNGLPILTPNYDRLIEVACEMAGFHVDTTAVGQYAGAFDHARSCMGSCRGVVPRGRTMALDHFPRAIVLKPHGSLDWFRHGTGGRRCSIDIDAERLIITPGLNKYKAGYNAPFDKHRELANNYINQAARLLIVGYGFNDDHLQTHLVTRIREGIPTLILTRTPSPNTRDLALQSPRCICLARPSANPGVSVLSKQGTFEHAGPDYWDIAVLTKELLT
jgi:hypothetical protein